MYDDLVQAYEAKGKTRWVVASHEDGKYSAYNKRGRLTVGDLEFVTKLGYTYPSRTAAIKKAKQIYGRSR